MIENDFIIPNSCFTESAVLGWNQRHRFLREKDYNVAYKLTPQPLMKSINWPWKIFLITDEVHKLTTEKHTNYRYWEMIINSEEPQSCCLLITIYPNSPWWTKMLRDRARVRLIPLRKGPHGRPEWARRGSYGPTEWAGKDRSLWTSWMGWEREVLMDFLNRLGKRGPCGLPEWAGKKRSLWTPWMGLEREVLLDSLNGLVKRGPCGLPEWAGKERSLLTPWMGWEREVLMDPLNELRKRGPYWLPEWAGKERSLWTPWMSWKREVLVDYLDGLRMRCVYGLPVVWKERSLWLTRTAFWPTSISCCLFYCTEIN